jgi:flap endonuclease-1
MAVDLSTLVSKRKIVLDELNGKTIAIDAYNVLYQFISIIRGPDGTPLSDSHGNVTSHLSGFFYRTIELTTYGIKPIYVFDGIPSILKQKTINARMKRREEAHAAWKEAMEKGNLEEAKTHAQASTRMTKEIVNSAKTLLGLMGIPCLNAPSEGEAQASHMCKQDLVYAAGSQDYDTMLFGSPRVIRNLTISGKRKLPRKDIYITVEPEIMTFKDTLDTLGLNQKQLIWIGMMLGTDYNEGVKGIGPKTALKVVKASGSLDDVVKYVREKSKQEFEVNPEELEKMFLEPEVKDLSKEEFDKLLETKPNKEKLIDFMCKEHDFSEERITKYAEKLFGIQSATRQKTMGNWTK